MKRTTGSHCDIKVCDQFEDIVSSIAAKSLYIYRSEDKFEIIEVHDAYHGLDCMSKLLAILNVPNDINKTKRS